MDIQKAPTVPLPIQVEPGSDEPRSRSKLSRGILVAAALVAAVVLGIVAASVIAALRVEKVFPAAPSVAVAECGVEPTVTIPEVKGVLYEQSRIDSLLTVTAIPASTSYELIGGAKQSWEIDLTPAPCPEPPEEPTGEAPEDGPDHVGEFIDGAQEVGSDVWDWTKEYGPGIWDRIKELGKGAKDSVEDWSRGGSE